MKIEDIKQETWQPFAWIEEQKATTIIKSKPFISLNVIK